MTTPSAATTVVAVVAVVAPADQLVEVTNNNRAAATPTADRPVIKMTNAAATGAADGQRLRRDCTHCQKVRPSARPAGSAAYISRRIDNSRSAAAARASASTSRSVRS